MGGRESGRDGPRVQRGGGGAAGEEAQGLACVCWTLGEQGQTPLRDGQR